MVGKSNKKKSKITVALRPAASKKKVEKEVTLLGRALRTLGSAAGGAVGGMFGAPIAGAHAGNGLGMAISKWLGSGDYSVSSNSIVSSVKASGSIPMMHNTGQSVIVRHKEFLMEVQSATSYTVQRSFTLNPGNVDTFPWLSRLANCYQQYRIRGLVFHYVPTSGSLSAGTSNALGTVMLQTSYRANDAAPASKIEMLNEYWSTEGAPMEAFAHPIECDPNENPFNVQYIKASDAELPEGDSPLLYDLGTTHVATSGQQAAGIALGDLWVTYEVELKKPIVSSNVTTSPFYFGFVKQLSPASFANPFGVLTATDGNFTFTTNASRQIVLPRECFGEFWIIVAFESSGGLNGPSITGYPALTGCIQKTWSATQDRYEFTTGGNGIAQLRYGTHVSKLQRETAATITIPLLSASAGTITQAHVTIIGTTNQ